MTHDEAMKRVATAVELAYANIKEDTGIENDYDRAREALAVLRKEGEERLITVKEICSLVREVRACRNIGRANFYMKSRLESWGFKLDMMHDTEES